MNENKIAKNISTICEAPFLAVPAFLFLNFYLNYENFFINELISLLFTSIFPIVFIYIFWRKKFNIDRDFFKKESRNIPLLIFSLLNFIGFIILFSLKSHPLVTGLMFCYSLNTLIVFLINLKWKISIHSMGVSGPTVVLIFAFGLYGAIFGLISPFVMWSRLKLKKHSKSQVIAGTLTGYFLTFLMMIAFFKVPNALASLWLIVGLILPLISLIIYLKKNNYFYLIFILIFLFYAPLEAIAIFILSLIAYFSVYKVLNKS